MSETKLESPEVKTPTPGITDSNAEGAAAGNYSGENDFLNDNILKKTPSKNAEEPEIDDDVSYTKKD